MESVEAMLRDADPLRHDPPLLEEDLERARRAVFAAASRASPPSPLRLPIMRPPLAVLAVVGVVALCAAMLGSRIWSVGSATVQAAAVRFEMRLADDAFTPGLRPARIAGSDRILYLHQEVIVTNNDISDSQVIPGRLPSRFSVGVTLNASGAEKMRRATTRPKGELIAILIDGAVVSAPRIRAPVSAAAVISGEYTKADAERIASGMRVR